MLNAELHCHNIYSNFHTGKLDTPYDSSTGIIEQLEQSLRNKLDLIFITNHNTLYGYNQMISYKNNHDKYNSIQIYPAEEITTSTGEHLLVYGIHNAIKPGLTVEETLDEAHVQNAISSAPHPFGIIDSLRDKSTYCDLIEIFNSNNIDIFSNVKAMLFADEHKIIPVCGSDSHIKSTIGRCMNKIESVNKLDDILYAMKHGKIKIQKTDYIKEYEMLNYLKYKINNSKDYIANYVSKNYSKFKLIFHLLEKSYQYNMDNNLWALFYKISIIALQNISFKINFCDFDIASIKNRNLKSLMSFILK